MMVRAGLSLLASKLWRYLHHKGLHVGDNAIAVVIEEVKPQHQAVVGMEALPSLVGDILGVSDEGIASCSLNLGRVEGALEGCPVGTES